MQTPCHVTIVDEQRATSSMDDALHDVYPAPAAASRRVETSTSRKRADWSIAQYTYRQTALSRTDFSSTTQRSPGAPRVAVPLRPLAYLGWGSGPVCVGVCRP